ncbi:arginase [Puteibacter caeruleilacunae]|nr:arginase [Puteibacter caeruleilacunae]
MELTHYLIPVDIDQFASKDFLHQRGSFGTSIDRFGIHSKVENFNRYDLAIIGVTDERNTSNNGCSKSVLTIREQLYKLARFDSQVKIIDLGNIMQGNTINDTYFALKDVCSFLVEQEIIPIIIGGDQDYTLPLIKVFENSSTDTNLVSVDPKFDFTQDLEPGDSTVYLNTIFTECNNTLYNVSCLGLQGYFMPPEQIDYFTLKGYDYLRLGEIRNNMEIVEPILRDADVVGFDISAIRASDAGAHINMGPNGFYAEEACRLMRYAGISDRVKITGIFGINPRLDPNNTTSMLTAQMIWYFIEGYINRMKDYPAIPLSNYLNYHVEVEEIDFPLIFYRSQKSERWWVEISWSEKQDDKRVVSCTKEDYEIAGNNEVPETWWRNFRKKQ